VDDRRRVSLSGLMPVVFVFLAAWVGAWAPAARPGVGDTGWQDKAAGPAESFTPAVRARLVEQSLAHLRASLPVKGQRLRVLSIKRLPPEKKSDRQATVSVLIFNYSQGHTTRLRMDLATGAVLREERLNGRPQPSEEELQEAREVIRADPEHARLLEAGGVLEGGFVVDDPGNQSTRDRFIQFHLLTHDRLHLQRFVTVNITAGRIAESRKP
jgi:hypothetical protein